MDLKKLNIINFSDGHRHLKLTKEDEYKLFNSNYDQIKMSITSFDDLFLLAQLKQILPQIKNLRIDYLLGARCDRRFSDLEALDLKIISNFINDLGFKKVYIHHPHSEISLALIDNSQAFYRTKDLFQLCVMEQKCTNYSVLAPDAGAGKWIEKVLGRYDVIHCSKIRDVDTGEVIGVKIPDDVNEDCIFVDDLCDGGRTFIELAIEAKKKGAKRIFLIISHAMFSKGFRVFDGLIDHIYCTNSFSDLEDTILTQIKI